MTLANLKPFIYFKILCIRIVGIYKVHINEINIKNRVYNYYFDNLIKAKNVETKNISIHEKNYTDLVIFLIHMFTASQ